MSDVRGSSASKRTISLIFKPVPRGYVYCAPDWAFGRSRCHPVNEERKAEITAMTTPRRPIL
jgi:hypothetical protein